MAEKSVRVDRSLVAVPRARKYRHRSRHMARDVSTGIFYTAGAGAIVALLANLDDIRNSKDVKEHWWLVPVGLIALGYMLRKRNSPHAAAVIAAGGAIFALAYSAQKKMEKQQAQQPAPPPPQQAFRNDTAGPYTALPEAHNGVWVQLPDGRLMRLPLLSKRAANATQYA
jgi:hypothetical protein